jgi:hypothetical protein
MSHIDQRQTVHQHSGWLVLPVFLSAMLLLSGLFLGWYLRPGPKAPAVPTDLSTLVKLKVRGQAFAIPANYIQNSAQAGGEQQTVALAALFPSWQGYSGAEARLFAGNEADSPIVRLSLHADANPLDAPARLSRIYWPYISDPEGMASPFGLTTYRFAKKSGYAREDLFVGRLNGKLLLFLCEQPSQELPGPNCLATDQPIGKSVSLSYRFKRTYLARWRELSSGVNTLMARFQPRQTN